MSRALAAVAALALSGCAGYAEYVDPGYSTYVVHRDRQARMERYAAGLDECRRLSQLPAVSFDADGLPRVTACR